MNKYFKTPFGNIFTVGRILQRGIWYYTVEQLFEATGYSYFNEKEHTILKMFDDRHSAYKYLLKILQKEERAFTKYLKKSEERLQDFGKELGLYLYNAEQAKKRRIKLNEKIIVKGLDNGK